MALSFANKDAPLMWWVVKEVVSLAYISRSIYCYLDVGQYMAGKVCFKDSTSTIRWEKRYGRSTKLINCFLFGTNRQDTSQIPFHLLRPSFAT